MVPIWLHDLSIISLTVGAICAAVLAIDEIRHPQRMWIMDVVWPTTALFGGLFWLWGYFRYFRQHRRGRRHARNHRDELVRKKHFAFSVAEGATHCGSGCVLGDLLAEWLAFAAPSVLVWFGWHTLFTQSMYAVWVLDFLFAYIIGIAFQYFAIAPMRGLTLGPGLVAAVKADTLSLTSWQIGMYGFMAIVQHGIIHSWLRADLPVNSVEYWFMMQIAMLAGFCTSYPVNWWLLRAGIKEAM